MNLDHSLVIDVNAEDYLVASAYTGNEDEQWNLQHLGGGEYKVTSIADGWAWDVWSSDPHVTQFWWGAAGSRCYIFRPTGDGFYQIVVAGSGKVFEPTGGEMSQVEEAVWSGRASQKWMIVAPGVPSFPTGLTVAEDGTTGANLSWNAVTGADSYKVKRSVVHGGPYTTISSGISGTSFADSGLNAGAQYFYVVSAVASGQESMNSAEVALRFSKLSGSIIGTSGSYNNLGDTIAKVFDGNVNTFFDAPSGNGTWAGLNFGSGTTNVVTQIKFCPRSGFAGRMVGGVFQGANHADFSDAVTLYTVGSNPAESTLTTVTLSESSGFKYVRYLAPNDGWGNVAEVEFYGYAYSEALPVPEGLAADALSSGLVHLSWNATEGATAYRIKRSTESDGPYDDVATVSEGTDYQDESVVDGVSYYYVVSAVKGERESANSEEAFVFSYPWDTTDVGSTLPGSASINNGTFTVEGGGADIWGRSDAFRYVYTEVSGNCTLVARVAGLENTDAWAKGGVMIRKSLAANSANALICVTPGNGISFQWRSTDGAECGFSNSGGLAAPHWIKLVRSGNSFTAYRSVNGTSWTQQGTPQTISMGTSVYIGLAVTAHNASLLSTATFDHVTLTATPPSAPASLEAVAESDAQINLSWAASALAETYSIKRSTVSGSDYVVVASNLTETAYDDVSDLTAGTRYYYVVCAMNVGGASADSAEASAVPSAEIMPDEYRIADCEVAGGTNMTMRVMSSIPGHAYQIWATDNLMSPDWQPVGTVMPGTGSDLDISVLMDGELPNCYFKLDVQRQ